MSPTDEVALRLRFGEHELPPESPDIGAFVRPGSGRGAPPRDAQTVGVLQGRQPLPDRSPLMIFFQYAGYGIPAIEHDGREPPIDLTSWSIRPTLFGYLASVPRPRRGRARARASWVMAACLPLVFPYAAEAAPTNASPSVQRPRTPPTIPPLPTDETGAEAELATEEPAASEVDPDPDSEASDPSLVEPPEPPTPEPPDAALPVLETDSSGPARATLDAAWEGVDGFDVEIELKGGRPMRGRVGAVQRDTFTLIQAETGAVLVLPKSGVVSLRVHMPPPLPTKTGTGSLIGGSILTAVGSPVFITGITFLAICPSCASLHLPMLLIGGGALAGGIPLLIRGTRRRQAYREALQERGVAPIAVRTRYGWTGGVRFRF